MKKGDIISLVCSGICAILWTIRVIMDLVSQAYLNSGFTFFLHLLCGVLWTIYFVVSLKRYYSAKKEQ